MPAKPPVPAASAPAPESWPNRRRLMRVIVFSLVFRAVKRAKI
jgi:hypothetical protein